MVQSQSLPQRAKMFDVTKFKYVKLLNQTIRAEKSSRAIESSVVSTGHRASPTGKVSELKGLMKLRRYITVLQQGDKKDKLLHKQLCLERDYIRELEKDKLRIKIERVLGQQVGGEYTLAEIGKVLGVTRERVRQIEDAAQKMLRHPLIARKLKTYQEN